MTNIEEDQQSNQYYGPVGLYQILPTWYFQGRVGRNIKYGIYKSWFLFEFWILWSLPLWKAADKILNISKEHLFSNNPMCEEHLIIRDLSNQVNDHSEVFVLGKHKKYSKFRSIFHKRELKVLSLKHRLKAHLRIFQAFHFPSELYVPSWTKWTEYVVKVPFTRISINLRG